MSTLHQNCQNRECMAKPGENNAKQAKETASMGAACGQAGVDPMRASLHSFPLPVGTPLVYVVPAEWARRLDQLENVVAEQGNQIEQLQKTVRADIIEGNKRIDRIVNAIEQRSANFVTALREALHRF